MHTKTYALHVTCIITIVFNIVEHLLEMEMFTHQRIKGKQTGQKEKIYIDERRTMSRIERPIKVYILNTWK